MTSGLYLQRIKPTEYGKEANEAMDAFPIPPDHVSSTPRKRPLLGFRRVANVANLINGELVVKNQFYASKFRVAAENKYGLSDLTPAVLIHPSMVTADDSKLSQAVADAQRRLMREANDDGRRGGRPKPLGSPQNDDDGAVEIISPKSAFLRAVRLAAARAGVGKKGKGKGVGSMFDFSDRKSAAGASDPVPKELVKEHGMRGARIIHRLRTAFAARRKKKPSDEPSQGSAWDIMRSVLVRRKVQVMKRRAKASKALVKCVPSHARRSYRHYSVLMNACACVSRAQVWSNTVGAADVHDIIQEGQVQVGQTSIQPLQPWLRSSCGGYQPHQHHRTPCRGPAASRCGSRILA